MNLVLELKNGDEKLLKALKSIVNLHPKAKLRIKKKKEKEEDIYTKEFIQSLEEMEREFEEDLKNGTLKTYNSVEEAFKAEGLI